MADSLHIGADFFASLEAYALSMNAAVHESARASMDHLQTTLRETASRSTRWSPISDHIDVWSQDGRYVVGVQNTEAVSEAMSAEYGDSEHPPVPLLRNMPQALQSAGQKMDEYLQNTGLFS